MSDHFPHFSSRTEQQQAHADLVSHVRRERELSAPCQEPERSALADGAGKRTFLVHLSIDAKTTDEHSADEIADDVIAVLRQSNSIDPYHVSCVLAEEI